MAKPPRASPTSRFVGVFGYSRRALDLVWTTSRPLTIALAVLTVVAGLLPAGVAVIGRYLVDGVVLAAGSGAAVDARAALFWVAAEGGVVVVLSAVQRGLGVSQSLLRVMLSNRVNVMILDKALELDLSQFEDAETYDQMTRARREASSRPLGLVRKTFEVGQAALTLATYAALLLAFSPLAVVIVLAAALPSFFAEARFADEGFRVLRWRAPETRERWYLETLVAREDHAKEVKLFDLGRLFVDRYAALFDKSYGEDRSLMLRRGAWGFALGLVSTVAFYGAYAWIAWATIAGRISLGEMTMYLLVFKQGQSAFAGMLQSIGGMYEDNLYLSDLYEFLDVSTRPPSGTATAGAMPGDGIRFESVSFTYPGAETPALSAVSLHLRPGEKLAIVGENGSGKTTLIKLLTRLYRPTAGRILLDGTELSEWDDAALRERIGVIFQDFVRYQFTIGENVGVGDRKAMHDEARWQEAARKGLALPIVEKLPNGFATQLGKWFHEGRELSLGQWQKVALSRAFMREDADILVLDEPTASVDAEAEVRIFDAFRESTAERMAILISHRFSTVRMADRIVVLDAGHVVEGGTHEQLVAQGGRYAHLFELQAAGYR